MLLILGGLPASGKSTISKGVVRELNAVYIRVDTIEQTLRDAGFKDVYSEGYEVAYALAAENLSLGSTVIADSVNSVSITRDAWRRVGKAARVPVLEIEIVCSDQEEHKTRVDTRVLDIEWLAAPTWDDVILRDYEPWLEANFIIDTAGQSPEQSVEEVLSLVSIHPTP